MTTATYIRNNRAIWRATQRRRESYESKFASLFRITLNRQFRELADRINEQNYNSRLLLDTITPDAIAKRYEQLYTLVGGDFAREQYNKLKGNDPDLLTKEEDTWFNYMRNYVKRRLWKRIENVNQTSVNTAGRIINDILSQTVEEGLGAYETATRIKKGLIEEGIKYNQWRALRIARTEIMTASNAGSMEGAKATGEALEKLWIATYDQRTRDTHMVIESQNPKMMNEKFHVGAWEMDHPGDPAGGPEEVINCRCAIAYNVIGWGGVDSTINTRPTYPNAPESNININPDVSQQIKNAQSIDELNAIARNSFGVENISHSVTNIESFREVLLTLKTLKNEFPDIPIKSIRRVDKANRSSAYADASRAQGLGLNETYFNDKARFEKLLDGDDAAFFHPKGANSIKGVVTHEFGHIATSNDLITFGAYKTDFHKAVMGIKSRYSRDINAINRKIFGLVKDDMNTLTAFQRWSREFNYDSFTDAITKSSMSDANKNIIKGLTNEFKSTYVSTYAKKNMDEFVAECFTSAKNNPGGNKYATEVYNLMKKTYIK